MAHSAMSPLASPRAHRAAMLWGIVVGLLQAATPLVFWWLDGVTVYALGLVVIASVYVGFAVADGRPKVIAVESSVTFAFVVVAAAAVTGSPWLLVAGLAAHGLGPLAHRTHFVANTRWWPPFCMLVDWVVAAIIAVEIAAAWTSASAGVGGAQRCDGGASTPAASLQRRREGTNAGCYLTPVPCVPETHEPLDRSRSATAPFRATHK